MCQELLMDPTSLSCCFHQQKYLYLVIGPKVQILACVTEHTVFLVIIFPDKMLISFFLLGLFRLLRAAKEVLIMRSSTVEISVLITASVSLCSLGGFDRCVVLTEPWEKQAGAGEQ